jgi:hypothetical protein
VEIVEVGGFPKGKGIEDFGHFNEGYCFKLNVEFPQNQIYVICADDVVSIIFK